MYVFVMYICSMYVYMYVGRYACIIKRCIFLTIYTNWSKCFDAITSSSGLQIFWDFKRFTSFMSPVAKVLGF
jgi:hypothetical protein